MEEIYPKIVGIKVANASEPIKHLILITVNDMNASLIWSEICNSVRLRYDYFENDSFFILRVENVDKDQQFKITIPLNKETESMMGWIALSQIGEVWVGYPDQTGKVVPYGLSKPVIE